MACYAFVSRKGQDILQEVSIPSARTGNPAASSCNELETFGHRMVFGFFEGQFTLKEVDCFMQDLALSAGTAPTAQEYFKSYNSDSKVSTGGITFQNHTHIPRKVLAIMEEYREVKYINERSFQSVQVEWFESLRALQPMQLPVNEP